MRRGFLAFWSGSHRACWLVILSRSSDASSILAGCLWAAYRRNTHTHSKRARSSSLCCSLSAQIIIITKKKKKKKKKPTVYADLRVRKLYYATKTSHYKDGMLGSLYWLHPRTTECEDIWWTGDFTSPFFLIGRLAADTQWRWSSFWATLCSFWMIIFLPLMQNCMNVQNCCTGFCPSKTFLN